VIGYLGHILATPSFWLTLAGALLAWFGYVRPGADMLLAVGLGGSGIALHLGVATGRDPWRVDTVLEALVGAALFRRQKCLFGLAIHLPQAVAGLLII